LIYTIIVVFIVLLYSLFRSGPKIHHYVNYVVCSGCTQFLLIQTHNIYCKHQTVLCALIKLFFSVRFQKLQIQRSTSQPTAQNPIHSSVKLVEEK